MWKSSRITGQNSKHLWGNTHTHTNTHTYPHIHTNTYPHIHTHTHTLSFYGVDEFFCVWRRYIILYVQSFCSTLHCKFIYFVYLCLVSHPTVMMIHLCIHGMYVCMKHILIYKENYRWIFIEAKGSDVLLFKPNPSMTYQFDSRKHRINRFSHFVNEHVLCSSGL